MAASAADGVNAATDDLHAWSIYRQNLNSDFTDSALGSNEKSPLPYGNFHLKEQTMAAIMANPKYGPKSQLGSNAFTYLKFGLPRVLPPKPAATNGSGSSTNGSSQRSPSASASVVIPVGHVGANSRRSGRQPSVASVPPGFQHRRQQPRKPFQGDHDPRQRATTDISSGYDSTDEEDLAAASRGGGRARSVPGSHFFRTGPTALRPARSEDHLMTYGQPDPVVAWGQQDPLGHPRYGYDSERPLDMEDPQGLYRGGAVSETDLFNGPDQVRRGSRRSGLTPRPGRRSQSQDRRSHRGLEGAVPRYDDDGRLDSSDPEGRDLYGGGLPGRGQLNMSKFTMGRLGGLEGPRLKQRSASQLSVARMQEGLSYRHDAPILNEKYFRPDEDEDQDEVLPDRRHRIRSAAAVTRPYGGVKSGGRPLEVNDGGALQQRRRRSVFEGQDLDLERPSSLNNVIPANGGPLANGAWSDGGGDEFEMTLTDDDGFKYPHLQLRNVRCETLTGSGQPRRWIALLDDINLEVRGGEIMAIMATKAEEGTALCDVIANDRRCVPRRSCWWGFSNRSLKVTGEVIVNGVQMEAASGRLRDRVAYVRTDCSFSQEMSVRQTMLFHAFMREPGVGSRARDSKGRINALVEDLGLAQVRHTRVRDLTASEKQRLNVACHLLLDADVVVLDQPTRGMDIFDTFFLVEYLRQWAARGRIVILTLQPPTYEILTMISKAVLVSAGRLMYFGKRREMLPYFAFIDYPCPAFKNPSDYYLDLVTLDNLSHEAMLESSQRINQLANMFQQRAEPLSDPGPPGMMPPKVVKANLFVQIFGLWLRAILYTYPFNVIGWVKQVLLAGTMSLLLGILFLGIRWRYWDRIWLRDPIFEQENISDRIGFHHVMMVVGIWPFLLSMIGRAWKSKPSITRDIDDGLYSKLAYLVAKVTFGLFVNGSIFIAYAVPGYLLAGIHFVDQAEPQLYLFSYYIGYMILYLMAIHSVAMAVTYLFDSRHAAAGFLGLIFLCMSLASGYLVYSGEVGMWAFWMKYLSPQWWMQHPILQDELLPVRTFSCLNNPLIIENSIIQKVPCGLNSGADAVRYYEFRSIFLGFFNSLAIPYTERILQRVNYGLPFIVTTGIWLIALIFSCLFFACCRQKAKSSRSKKYKIM